VHALVKANPLASVETREPVLDRLNVLYDLAVYTALFAHLAHRGDLWLLVLLYKPLRQLPSVIAADSDDHYFDSLIVAAKHDAASGDLLSNGQLHTVTPAYFRCHKDTLSRTSRVSIRAIRPGRFSMEIG